MRIVSRLDIKNDYLIKGLALEGLRKLGNAKDFAKKYYQFGIDEIIYIDTVASLYSREGIFKILMETVQEVFVPITVGGGIRSIEDIQTALNAGADKVAINTKAVQDPRFIKRASEIFGSQCIVVAIVPIVGHRASQIMHKGFYNILGARAMDINSWVRKQIKSVAISCFNHQSLQHFACWHRKTTSHQRHLH